MAIDARQPADGSGGGVAWITEGLLRALGTLDDGNERYLVVGHAEQRERLQALCGGRLTFVAEAPTVLGGAQRALGQAVRRSPIAQGVEAACRDLLPRRAAGPARTPDPLLEGLDCDLIHFPSQFFRATKRPTVYNPHDLQHLHFPAFFRRHEFQQREAMYRWGCRDAGRIAVSSAWVKRDLVGQYGIAPERVQVIPWGIDPTLGQVAQPDLDALRRRLGGLSGPFALYPAATWEHKNHLRLIEALAMLRDDHGLRLGLVCCGHQTRQYPKIRRHVRALKLDTQVVFPGVLPQGELDAAYRAALFVVIPSLFEASSAPMREAWRWRRPVACAAVTSLPEQAGDSALLFDPLSPAAIAATMHRLAIDKDLRADLVARGSRRILRFDWARTARAYRALYRTVTGVPTSRDDLDLLAHDWMTAP